jgi:ABC-type nitrate/sulfonate/bicarbonate transport system substrate-binding protein
MAVATVLAVLVAAGAADAADTLVLQLHGPASFEFAGYYAALWQGFYNDAGLAIEIKPGAGRGEPPIDPVREVTEGRAQFGTGTAELMVRTAQGLPLLLLAPVFQQSGAAVYYRAESDFPSPGALAKAKLARLSASDILDIELATALKAEGVDRAKLKSVTIDPAQIVTALGDKSVDAAIGSPWDVPYLAQNKGIALKFFNPADYRVEFYGDTLFALQRLANREGQTVRSFRAASLKGWDYALQRPDEIARRMLAELPHPPGIPDPAGFARYQVDLARRLARYPEIELGHANPDRWERIEASMLGVGAVLRTADTGDFVYDPDAEARNRGDLRSLTIIGATLVIALGVTAWLWLGWRRRPVAAADPSVPLPAHSAEPATAAPRTSEPPAAPPTPEPVVAAPVMPSPREPAPEDLNTILARLEGAMRQRVPRRVAFRLSLLPELWPCRTDPPPVRSLVLDLVTAAAAELKGSGELVVGTRNAAFDAVALLDTPDAQIGDFVRITVRDSGPGLSEEALDRIFDPFATPRPSAAVAAAAMHDFGGFARVESALGIGTAVHLYFPRTVIPVDGTLKGDKTAEAAALS